MPKETFTRDVEMDARLVIAARNGLRGVVDYAFSRRDLFPTTTAAVDRALWFKRQDDAYISEVAKRAAELEIE